MIPPNDVGLLTATPGDAKVSLKWGPPPERNIAAIYVKNINTNTEKKLGGDATEVEFIGLTNFTAQDFIIKTENDKGLLSFGAKISAIPFSTDNVKPGKVINLMGFKLNATSALATWNNPADIDLAQIEVTLGNEKVTVPRESNYALIDGDVNNPLNVYAIDFSGNRSEVTSALVDKNMVAIAGTDNGEYETLTMTLDPSVVIIDEYRITYAGGTVITASVADGTCHIPMADLQATSVWKQPIKVGLVSNGKLVTEYDYYAYNDIAGTIRAAFFDTKENNVNIEGDMRNIGSLGNGSVTTYNVHVSETGTYSVTAYQARPDGSSTYEIYMDDVLLGTGTVGGTGNWGPPYNPFPGPDNLNFEAGEHVLKIIFRGSGNYEKFLFTKN
ncbi:hypothetical protein AGMMS50239_13180 [Bacteroidia bacterium]|nr:hypothetical protein AGMMS50239_13180 [Bacteroidia bacterium]